MNTAKEKNRGYYKIEGAVRAFNFDFRDKTVLDIGSSTGGFTELALEKGAKKVIAIEKGTNQMKTPLRFDPRIDLHEKTDIFNVVLDGHARHKDLAREAQSVPKEGHAVFVACPDTIVADVSFISLTKILAYAKINLTRPTTEFLVMLKPQFEARPDQLRNGIVKNETTRRDIIKNFEYWLKSHGFIVINKHDNTLTGKNGNVERFYYLKLAK